MKPFRRIIIIGMGQIGSSIARGLRRAGFSGIVGLDRPVPPHRLRTFREDDFVILAVPVRAILGYLKHLTRVPLIIDVGSTKRSIVRLARRRHLRFLGTHPVAGTERSGPQAGDPDLFRGHLCFFAVRPSISRQDLRWIRRIWKALGARVQWIEAERHDALFAAISHLPHAVSFSLMKAAAPRVRREKVRDWVEGSFRDMTRVAASPPVIWRDIFRDNRTELIPLIDRFVSELRQLRSLIRSPNAARLEQWLGRSRQLRERLR